MFSFVFYLSVFARIVISVFVFVCMFDNLLCVLLRCVLLVVVSLNLNVVSCFVHVHYCGIDLLLCLFMCWYVVVVVVVVIAVVVSAAVLDVVSRMFFVLHYVL